ncbi:MAG: NADH-quinone oxidoreductase subunit H [Fimbriimonas ginsengisoli]|uniref:NADH-quinone oxidoreductase subunit H n=1 Tax=Fimbriimonas ginsengisoli TaxID=1005039 RepID=A0A931PUW9_FIMGI|nr:NADH-quinone oxidoreductase subunit H [Fimbriimonas ginsengisoli]
MSLAIHIVLLIALPLLLSCVIRKTKALMQGRPGPPLFQPIFDLVKRFRKGETVSSTASWIFRANPLVGLSIALVVAMVVPWTGAEPLARGSGTADLILIVYLLAMARFFSLLAALDTGSAFGGLGASREAALAVLIEPSILVSLSAVALASGTMDLSVALQSPVRGTVALLSGSAFLLAALAELSRMPVDDPTTHLELTMIHEATILENSGRNLALIETTVALRTAVFFGVGVQILLGKALRSPDNAIVSAASSAAAILMLGCLLGVLEGIAVKLNWRRVPSFVAFSTALAVMSAFVAAVGA